MSTLSHNVVTDALINEAVFMTALVLNGAEFEWVMLS